MAWRSTPISAGRCRRDDGNRPQPEPVPRGQSLARRRFQVELGHRPRDQTLQVHERLVLLRQLDLLEDLLLLEALEGAG